MAQCSVSQSMLHSDNWDDDRHVEDRVSNNIKLHKKLFPFSLSVLFMIFINISPLHLLNT